MAAVERPAVPVELAAVPPAVEVEPEHLGDAGDPHRVVVAAAAVDRHRRVARGVLGTGEAVHPGRELADLAHVGRVDLLADPGALLAPQEDLVHGPPEDHRGVVVVLPDHLLQHRPRVLLERLGDVDVVDHRDLLPDQQPEAVGGLQDGRVLRVVREAEEVGAHLLDPLEVADVPLVRQRRAEPLDVLVAVGAVEDQPLAVEEEPLVRIEAEPAEAERARHAVRALPVDVNLRRDTVKRGVVRRPQLRVRDPRERQLDRLAGAGGESDGLLRAADLAAPGVRERMDHAGAPLSVAVVDDGAPDRRGGALARDLGRRDEHAGGPVVVHREVDGVGGDEPHVAVDAPVEGVPDGEGRDVGVVAVVDLDGDEVIPPSPRDLDLAGVVGLHPGSARGGLAERHQVRDLDRERGVAPLVAPGEGAVDVDVGDLVGPFEVEEQPLSSHLVP